MSIGRLRSAGRRYHRREGSRADKSSKSGPRYIMQGMQINSTARARFLPLITGQYGDIDATIEIPECQVGSEGFVSDFLTGRNAYVWTSRTRSLLY